MANGVIYPGGELEITVSDKIAIFTEDKAQVYYKYDLTNFAPVFEYSSTVDNSEVVLTPGANVSIVRINAKNEKVYYSTGSAPTTSRKVTSQVASPANAGESISTISVVRNTIADAATITVAQHRDQVMYQDATGANVACTTATATALAAEFPEMKIGDALPQYFTSNQNFFYSEITGGTGVTVVGLNQVYEIGGTFLLVKTGAATFDLVRVG